MCTAPYRYYGRWHHIWLDWRQVCMGCCGGCATKGREVGRATRFDITVSRNHLSLSRPRARQIVDLPETLPQSCMFACLAPPSWRASQPIIRQARQGIETYPLNRVSFWLTGVCNQSAVASPTSPKLISSGCSLFLFPSLSPLAWLPMRRLRLFPFFIARSFQRLFPGIRVGSAHARARGVRGMDKRSGGGSHPSFLPFCKVPYLNDVYIIFRILDPIPPCLHSGQIHSTKSTQPPSPCLHLGNPLPLSV